MCIVQEVGPSHRQQARLNFLTKAGRLLRWLSKMEETKLTNLERMNRPGKRKMMQGGTEHGSKEKTQDKRRIVSSHKCEDSWIGDR